jgi:hypothetical protein
MHNSLLQDVTALENCIIAQLALKNVTGKIAPKINGSAAHEPIMITASTTVEEIVSCIMEPIEKIRCVFESNVQFRFLAQFYIDAPTARVIFSAGIQEIF